MDICLVLKTPQLYNTFLDTDGVVNFLWFNKSVYLPGNCHIFEKFSVSLTWSSKKG